MEQIKDIFKQVRQAKGSLAFCKEEIINDTKIWRRWIP